MWNVQKLTLKSLYLVSLTVVVACLPPSGSGGVQYSDAASGADSPALTAEDVILNEDVASLSGNQLHFPKLREGYLKESGLRAVLEIEVGATSLFSLHKFGMAMNGGLGHYSEAFDLNRVSRWNLEGPKPLLYVEVGKLDFQGDRSFFEQALRVQNRRGRVTLWLLSPAISLVKARLLWVRERPSRVPSGLMSVEWTSVPPASSDRRAVEFRFQSPEGQPLFFECAKDKSAFRRCESPVSFSKLAFGSHVFYARAVDVQKRRGPFARYAFEIIKATNEIVIQRTEPAVSPSASDSLQIWFAPLGSLEKKSKIVCRLDDAAFAACASPWSLTGLAEGWHEARVQVRNKKGDLIGEPARYAWIVDRTAPLTQFRDAPSPLTSAMSALFSWIVSEESTFRCQLDGGAEAACESPLEMDGLSAGAHRFSFYAIDEAGNRSESLEYAWTIDAQAPRLSFGSILPAEPVTASSSLEVSFESSEPTLYQCKVDEASEEGCVSPFQVSGLGEGDHLLEIVGVDMAGNVSDPLVYRWTVDKSRPQVTIEWESPGASPTRERAATFRFVSSDAVQFYCNLDQSGSSPCVSPIQYADLAEGEHLLIVTAINGAGLASEPVSFGWHVDLTAPRLLWTRFEPNAERTSSHTMSLEFEADEAGITQCELDGAGYSACLSPVSLSGLADGGHAFNVISRDTAGNLSEAIHYEWTVESIPVVAWSSILPAESLTSARQIQFTFSSNLPSTFECRLDNDAFSLCESPWLREGLTSGSHSAEVRALNSLGVAGPSVQHGWVIDAEGPVIEWLGAEPAAALTSSRDMELRFTSEAGARFFCRLDAGTEEECTSPVTLENLPDGSHVFHVVAQDALDNRSAAFVYEWQVDATAPLLSSLQKSPQSNPQSVREASVSVSASEPVDLICRLDGGAEVACSSPYQVTSLVDGSHEIQVRGRDAAGNESVPSKLTFSVDATAPSVSLLYHEPAMGLTSSRQMEIAFVASEPGSFECTLDAHASVGCVSPYRLSALSDGAHRVEIRAKDAAGNSSSAAVVTWEVDATTPSVMILSRNPSGDISATNTLAVTFASSEPASFFCSLDGQSPIACSSPYQAAGLGEGSHVFQVHARDAAGNESAPQSFGWAIDTVRPTVTSLTRNPAVPVVNQNHVSVLFSGSENGTFHCVLDGAPSQPCFSPLQLTGLVEGSHVLSLQLKDEVGNASEVVVSSWTVDTIVPSIQGYSRNPSADPSSSRSFQLGFSANEIVTFHCALDGAAAAACSSPIALAALVDGVHAFQLYARDAAGNQSPVFVDTWTVDGTSPVMNLTLRNPGGSLVSSRNVSIHFNSNEPSAALFCSFDGSGFSPCTSPFQRNGLSEGSHTFQAFSSDAAGNQSATASDIWTVDSVAPIMISLARLPAGELVSSHSAVFTFSSNDPTASFFCSLDGAAAAACASPYSLSGLADGNHSFRVYGKDAAGNESADLADVWTIDATAPSLSIGVRVPAGAVVASRNVSLPFSSTDLAASFFCSLDGAAAVSCSSPFLASNLSDGNHSVQVFAKDAAGNQSAVSSETWAVDVTAPAVAIVSRSPVGSVVTTRSISISFSSTDASAGFFCSLDGAAVSACASPYSASGLIDGNHVFQVYAKDAVGNQSGVVSESWSIDATAPSVILGARTPAGSLVTSRAINIVFSSSDASAVFFCSLDGGTAAACGSPFAASNLVDGNHTFQVYAKDSAGNQSGIVSDAWTVDATAPVVSLGARNPSGASVTSRSVSIAFSSADASASFFCAFDGATATACSSPFMASGLVDGGHSFQVYAKDAAGNQSAAVSDAWAIDASAPVLSLGVRTPAGASVTSRSVSISFSANEAGTAFFCSLDGATATSCSSPLTASGLADGGHSFQVYAKDALGNQSSTLTESWVVDATAPVISLGTRTPAGTLVNVRSVSISFSADDPSASFFCSLDAATATACSSPFSAGSLIDGTHTFVAFAKDALGNQSNVVNDAWTVDATVPQIVWGAMTPSYSPSIATSKTIAFSATETSSFWCSFDNGAWSVCASPFNRTGLSDGVHQLQVRAQDLAGNSGPTATRSWEVNTAALTTSSVSIGSITQSSALVSWVTSVPANSRLAYGTGSNLNLSTVSDPANVTTHGMALTGLNRFTLYSVQTISIDADGRETRSPVRTFRTAN